MADIISLNNFVNFHLLGVPLSTLNPGPFAIRPTQISESRKTLIRALEMLTVSDGK